MIGLNKYIGKAVLFPSAILFSLIAIFMALYIKTDFAWVSSGWFVWPFVIVCLALGVRLFVALPKILGATFEK